MAEQLNPEWWESTASIFSATNDRMAGNRGLKLMEKFKALEQELATWHQEFTVVLDDGKEYVMDALEAGKSLADVEARVRVTMEDRAESVAREASLIDLGGVIRRKRV